MQKTKLYNLSGSDFRLPIGIDRNRQIFTSLANDIPLMSWPDGRWCTLVNLFVLYLYRRGLSRRDGGGTLKTYAAYLSHLIRYCFYKKIEFYEVDDNNFSLFIEGLKAERLAENPHEIARRSDSVIAIGRISLEFLSYVGSLYNIDQFVASTGQIRADRREYQFHGEKLRNIGTHRTLSYWHHWTFPAPDPKVRRLPISAKAIDLLRSAVSRVSSSYFLIKRRYVMLKLLEITGARRTELASLTVSSVLDTAKMSHPMLKLITVKKRHGKTEFRYVPISHHDVRFLVEYIEKNRRPAVRKSCGIQNDTGYLLISETTGKKLAANTITQEVAMLAKTAGIQDKTCPHMFRHRFITKVFVALIQEQKFENKDDLRRALLDIESIKQKVQQMTGHSNLNSLNEYINLAFEEITNFRKPLNVVNAKRAVDSFKATIEQFAHEVSAGLPLSEACQQLKTLASAFSRDLELLE